MRRRDVVDGVADGYHIRVITPGPALGSVYRALFCIQRRTRGCRCQQISVCDSSLLYCINETFIVFFWVLCIKFCRVRVKKKKTTQKHVVLFLLDVRRPRCN